MVSNIAGRKRIEELRAVKERLEYLLRWSPVIVYTCEPYEDYVVTFVSENVLSLLGYEPREFIEDPRFWPNHIHPEEVTCVLTRVCRLFEKGHYTHEYRFLHRNGTYRWVHDEMRLARDDTGRPSEIIGYLVDITEQKRMEETLLKTERLAAVGEMTAMLGHDLRNPLTEISGAAYYLKKKLAPSLDRESLDMLDLIERAIEYASKIMNDLLEYSREIRLELAETDPGSITEQALAFVKVPRNVRVSNLTNTQPRIAVDVTKMTRVFVNLIRNAVDAMPQGGDLTLASQEKDGNVQITFTDTGTGIPNDAMERIWTPFLTTKAKGMGLGLAIVKRLVEAHNGTITVESKIGEGSAFTVRLPLRMGRIKEEQGPTS